MGQTAMSSELDVQRRLPMVAINDGPPAYAVSPAGCRWRGRLRLLVAGIVVGIDVGDSPGSSGIHLEDRFFCRPPVVTRAGRDDGDPARAHFMPRLLVKLVAHPKVDLALDDGDDLVARMSVGRDPESGRSLETIGERPRLRRIT